MTNVSLLFIDQRQTSGAEIEAFKLLHAGRLPATPLQIVNFFSSRFEDLQLISKHRVVLLPTYVFITQTNKTVFRVSGRLPTSNNLELLGNGDTKQ